MYYPHCRELLGRYYPDDYRPLYGPGSTKSWICPFTYRFIAHPAADRRKILFIAVNPLFSKLINHIFKFTYYDKKRGNMDQSFSIRYIHLVYKSTCSL